MIAEVKAEKIGENLTRYPDMYRKRPFPIHVILKITSEMRSPVSFARIFAAFT